MAGRVTYKTLRDRVAEVNAERGLTENRDERYGVRPADARVGGYNIMKGTISITASMSAREALDYINTNL